jgi:phospholipid transport system substrate-binding protein
MAAALLLSALLAAIGAAGARADDGAERFARQLIDEGFSILRDDSLPAQARRDKFHTFILGHVDGQRTALFTLGVYRRSVSEAVLTRFIAVFTEYSTAIYETHLVDYKNATLTVVSSIENKPGDVTVMTSAEDPSLREPLRVGFRLSSSGGTYRIVDIQAAGIWLSVEQRDQFAALLSRNNGDVAALTDELVKRTANIRAAKTT